MFIEFDQAALLAILENNYGVKRRTLVVAEPDLLRIAVDNCSTPWGGQGNPAPGTVHGDTGVYMRSGEFVRTLDLTVLGNELSFSSSATSYRKGYGPFNYGQALIEGRSPFDQAYKLLPPEFYD